MENRYCVYLHKRKDDGVIFYIGSGTLDRSKTSRERSKSWSNIVNLSGGFDIEIVQDNISKEDSLILENYLIENPNNSWELVNQHMFTTIDYNSTDWNSLFYYDETSKSCLRWKGSKYKARNGQEVGSYH